VLLKGDRAYSDEFVKAKLREWTGQTGIPFTVVWRPGAVPVLLSGIYGANDLVGALGTGEE
jgi:hypothetical protein